MSTSYPNHKRHIFLYVTVIMDAFLDLIFILLHVNIESEVNFMGIMEETEYLSSFFLGCFLVDD